MRNSNRLDEQQDHYFRRKELDDLRHAVLATIGWLNGQSILTRQQVQELLVESVRHYVTGKTRKDEPVSGFEIEDLCDLSD